MSFAVSVNTEERDEREDLYWSPVAADGEMGEWWSRPAARLGLPLLARACDEGLKVHGQELVALRREVDSSERLLG